MTEKTEAPTEKKQRDAAKKGQVFNPRDLCMWISLSGSLAWLSSTTDFPRLFEPWRRFILRGMTSASPGAMAGEFTHIAIGIIVPTLIVAIVLTSVISLLASRFRLATEALAPDFERLDPVQGFSRLFSLRTLSETTTAVSYCASTVVAVWLVIRVSSHDVFSSVWIERPDGALIWRLLVLRPLIVLLACFLPVCLFHTWIEMRLHTRDLRMEKREVRDEARQLEGSPEVKGRRRDLLIELLDEQSRQDIAGSRFVLANPTHVAVGIYLNPDIVEWPFVSVREANRRALAVIAYAESVGVPVVREKRLARRVFRETRRYGFVDPRAVEEVMRVVNWLAEVEKAGMDDAFVQAPPEAQT